MVILSSPVVVIAVLIIILLPVLVVLSLRLLGRVAQEEGRDAVKEILDVLNLEKFGCTPPRHLTSVSASLDSVSNYVNINMQKLFGYYFRSNEVTDSLLCGGRLHQGGDKQNKARQGEQAELLLVLEWFGGG